MLQPAVARCRSTDGQSLADLRDDILHRQTRINRETVFVLVQRFHHGNLRIQLQGGLIVVFPLTDSRPEHLARDIQFNERDRLADLTNQVVAMRKPHRRTCTDRERQPGQRLEPDGLALRGRIDAVLAAKPLRGTRPCVRHTGMD